MFILTMTTLYTFSVVAGFFPADSNDGQISRKNPIHHCLPPAQLLAPSGGYEATIKQRSCVREIEAHQNETLYTHITEDQVLYPVLFYPNKTINYFNILH